MPLEPDRWTTHFGQWVCDVGAADLSSQLCAIGQPVTPSAVYKWMAGVRAPRAGCALAIVRISRGAVTLDDVYGHRREVEGG